MKCPKCNAETSDMIAACEWCGAPLYGGAPQAPSEQPPLPQGEPRAGYPPQYAPQGLPREGQVPPEGQYVAPGDATWRPPAPPAEPRAAKGSEPLYLKPWPYVIAIVLVIAVVAGLFMVKKTSSKSYPDLVVNGRPTLLDFFTDT